MAFHSNVQIENLECTSINDVYLSSFLSQYVSEILHSSQTCNSENMLTPDGFLNWGIIDDKLNLSEYSRDSVCYKEVLKNLSTAFNHVCDIYSKISIEDFDLQYGKCLDWTNNKQLFLQAFKLLARNTKCDPILAALILTAGIERSLGNVYLMKGDEVPYLLKDLLNTNELKFLIGNAEMALIDIIMGTPISLNLRNILWHGFVLPPEIDRRYGYFLIILTISLHSKLHNLNSPCRPFLSLEKCHFLQGTFPELEQRETKVLHHVFQNTSLIVNSAKPFWVSVLLEYGENRFGETIVLLLPQFESILRIIFAISNHCPKYILTAEPDTRYITLTEIFSEFLQNGLRNQIRSMLSDKEMEMLLDVFMHGEGPRLRDRISHGEINIFEIPKYLVSHMLCLAALLCIKFINEEDSILQEDFLVKLRKFTNYQSFYHPSSFYKRTVLSLVQSFKSWNSCHTIVPEIFKPDNVPHPSLNCLTNTFDSSFSNESSFSEDLQKYENLLNDIDLSTVHRPKSESELTTLLRKIGHHALMTSENVITALKNFYNSWQEKSLRSRQRDTYARLLGSLSILYEGLKAVIILLVDQLYHLNHTHEHFEQLVKFLKFVLKYVENLSHMTAIKTNKWTESVTCTEDFLTRFRVFQNL